jgi:hypothetical protein
MTDRALVGNAADPRQVKAAKKQEKQNRARARADLQTVVASEQGRRFTWSLLEQAGVFQSNHALDDYNRGIAEGRRRIGLELMVMLNEIDPVLYFRIAKEAQELDSMTTTPPEQKPDDTQQVETGEEETES